MMSRNSSADTMRIREISPLSIQYSRTTGTKDVQKGLQADLTNLLAGRDVDSQIKNNILDAI